MFKQSLIILVFLIVIYQIYLNYINNSNNKDLNETDDNVPPRTINTTLPIYQFRYGRDRTR